MAFGTDKWEACRLGTHPNHSTLGPLMIRLVELPSTVTADHYRTVQRAAQTRSVDHMRQSIQWSPVSRRQALTGECA